MKKPLPPPPPPEGRLDTRATGVRMLLLTCPDLVIRHSVSGDGDSRGPSSVCLDVEPPVRGVEPRGNILLI